MAKKSLTHNDANTVSCFEETPLINVGQFAFLIFDNLKQIPSSSPGKIEVEAWVSKHVNVDDFRWIVEESEKVGF